MAYLASVILPIFEHVYGIPHEGICPLPRKERPKCGARNRQGKRCSVRVFCPLTAGTAAIICPVSTSSTRSAVNELRDRQALLFSPRLFATAVRVLEAQKCLDPFHVPKINCC